MGVLSQTWVIAEPIHIAEAYSEPHTESLHEIAERVAREMDFDPQIVFNVIDTETGGTWDCTLVGAAGERGCFQIMSDHKVDPLDFEASTRYFIESYKAGYGWWWTGCSCVKSAKLTVPQLKGNAADVQPNATLQTGKIAIFDYDGTRHVFAYKIAPEGLWAVLEGNYEPCVIRDRLIPWDEVNKHLVGFWTPTTSP